VLGAWRNPKKPHVFVYLTVKPEVSVGQPELAECTDQMISMSYAKISWNAYSMRFSAVSRCSAKARAHKPFSPGFLRKLINKHTRQYTEQATEQATNEIKVSTPTIIVLQIRPDVRG
jgi:hypothetical protein